MEITKINNKDNLGCNCCNRGKINKEDNTQLIYPYSELWEITFNGISIRICKDCLYDLKDVIINVKIKEDNAKSEDSEEKE